MIFLIKEYKDENFKTQAAMTSKQAMRVCPESLPSGHLYWVPIVCFYYALARFIMLCVNRHWRRPLVGVTILKKSTTNLLLCCLFHFHSISCTTGMTHYHAMCHKTTTSVQKGA